MPTAHTIKRIRELHNQGCSLQEIVVAGGQWVELLYSKSDLQEIRRVIGQALKENQ